MPKSFFSSTLLLRYFSCSAPADIFLCSCDPLPSIALPLSSLFLYLSLHPLPMLWCNTPHWISEDKGMTGRERARERRKQIKRWRRKSDFFFSAGMSSRLIRLWVENNILFPFGCHFLSTYSLLWNSKVFFFLSCYYGNSQSADMSVLTVCITGPCLTFPRSQQDTAYMESWEQCTVSYLKPRPPNLLLSQQMFASFINYSGCRLSCVAKNPAQIDFWKILSGGMPYIPHGYLWTPLRGQQGPCDWAAKLLLCKDKACTVKFAKSIKLSRITADLLSI